MVIIMARHVCCGTDTNGTNPGVLDDLFVCLFFPLTVVLNLPADPASFAS